MVDPSKWRFRGGILKTIYAQFHFWNSIQIALQIYQMAASYSTLLKKKRGGGIYWTTFFFVCVCIKEVLLDRFMLIHANRLHKLRTAERDWWMYTPRSYCRTVSTESIILVLLISSNPCQDKSHFELTALLNRQGLQHSTCFSPPFDTSASLQWAAADEEIEVPSGENTEYYYKYCFTSTEAMRLIRDGRAPLTSSDTQSRELSEHRA